MPRLFSRRVPGFSFWRLLDRDPVAPGLQAVSHPGVSSVDGYVTAAGRLGVDAVVTEKVRAVAGFRLGWDQPHLISAAEPGQDRGEDGVAIVRPPLVIKRRSVSVAVLLHAKVQVGAARPRRAERPPVSGGNLPTWEARW